MRKLLEIESPAANGEQAASDIQGTLQAYEIALNAADTNGVLAVFVHDGVFMAPNTPTTVGADAIRAAYDGIFKAITFETELTVEEVVQVAPDWAFARTSSNGHVIVNGSNQRVPDANHELFILKRSDNREWRIARYSFATTMPVTR